MLFNSFSFALFLPIVFILNWALSRKGLYVQNVLLLIASYYFYANWDYRFLALLMFSTALDYATGIAIHHATTVTKRKLWLWLSIGVNLGFLGAFKYYNFFVTSFAEFSNHFGLHPNITTLSVILPVGISFYTFHGLSYVIDLYNKRIEPEYNFIHYSLFVSFFPLLVAGPIERATHLLPQITRKRVFNYEQAIDGLRQILWGLFKKIAIADFCAVYVNYCFNDMEQYNGSTLALGAVLFAFQIYCDFSGYSDIALGTAKLFGINLLRNFAFPYFSRDIAEFWRRWHISLSSWFKDYVYIPLGGSKGSVRRQISNTFIIFLLSGFWHGANWTFIAWGLLNAIYFLPIMLMKSNRTNLETVAQNSMFPNLKEFTQIGITFALTTLAWVFFRAENLSQAFAYLQRIFSVSLFSSPELLPFSLFGLILLFIGIEWIGRREQFALAKLGNNWPRPLRWVLYYSLIILTIQYSGNEQAFIYFQF